jgi:predicted  nucleic acid-binding Zn-ribbon protein
MSTATTSREAEILQAEIDRLHEQLTAKHDEVERLKDENRQLWADRQAASKRAASLQAKIDHLTDEANRWGTQA